MNQNETRYKVISALLQADEPLALRELVDRSGFPEERVSRIVEELAAEDLIVQGELLPGEPGRHFCWGARWAGEAERRAAGQRERLRAIVGPPEVTSGYKLQIDDEAVLAFHNFVVNDYAPPADKRFLVFLQCSVRRPFSSAPSHASMRRAISVATGHDPAKDFGLCPVHVVVLASKIGPVPYELEDVYPANVSAGGVKQFDTAVYARLKPILAQRMAEYMIAYRGNYDRMATFTDGRYGQVMREAKKLAGVEFPVLPSRRGPQVTRMGDSRPRRYWEKYWIQLYLEIVSWLEPEQRARAEERLKSLDVVVY
jgi:hypothetical protein